MIADKLQTVIAERRQALRQRDRRIAVLPIVGELEAKPGPATLAGGTALDLVAEAFAEALDDDDALAVLLLVHGSGRSADGVAVLADQLAAGRRRKRVWAICTGRVSGAALVLATAAERVIATGDAKLGGPMMKELPVGVHNLVMARVGVARQIRRAEVERLLGGGTWISSAGARVADLIDWVDSFQATVAEMVNGRPGAQ